MKLEISESRNIYAQYRKIFNLDTYNGIVGKKLKQMISDYPELKRNSDKLAQIRIEESFSKMFEVEN